MIPPVSRHLQDRVQIRGTPMTTRRQADRKLLGRRDSFQGARLGPWGIRCPIGRNA